MVPKDIIGDIKGKDIMNAKVVGYTESYQGFADIQLKLKNGETIILYATKCDKTPLIVKAHYQATASGHIVV